MKPTKACNDNPITNENKMNAALNLYMREILVLIKRCMLLAGFENNETNESGQLYIYFMGRTLEYEFERLKIINKCKPESSKSELDSMLQVQKMNMKHSSRMEMMEKAMMRYRFESCYAVVKCMLHADFSDPDIEIYNPTYQLFLEKALHEEYICWKHLNSSMKLKVKIESNAKIITSA